MSAVLLVVAAVSLWLSAGALAVVDGETMRRIGILPPIWGLAALAVLCAAVTRAGRFEPAHLWPLGLTVLLWLPWLPGRIPAAFLLWTGPLGAVVWVAALAGVVAARWPHLSSRLASLLDHPRAPLVASLLAAAAYLGAAAAVAPRVPTGDEPHYLIITQSLLADGDLRIENNHAREDYRAYYPGQLRPDYLRRGVDREIYSVHLPGVSALVLPAFALAGYRGATIFLALLTAAAGLAVWRAAHLATGDRRAAWVGWAAVMLTTPVVFHAFTVYPDGPGAAAVAVGLAALAALDARGAGGLSRAALAATGAALAVLPWLHTRFAVVAGVLGLAILLRLWGASDRLVRAGALLVVPCVAAVGWFAYFWTIYGTPSPTAPYGGYTQTALRHVLTGLPGLLLDQQFGLLPYAPVYVVALAGIVPLARARPRLALELALVVGPYALAVGSYAMWWGGFSAPARFTVAVLPAAAVTVAAAWRTWTSRAARTAVAGALALSLAVPIALAGVERGALLYETRTGYGLLLEWANASVDLSLALPAIHRGNLAAVGGSAAMWAAALAAATWLLSRAAQRWRPAAGAWWLVAGSVAAAAAMVAVSAAWAVERARPVTPGASQMALLDRWRPAWQPHAVQLAPIDVLSAGALAPRLLLGSPRPRGLGEDVLLAIPRLPAGEYALVLAGDGELAGMLTAEVGREGGAIERWPLDGRRGPDPAYALSLPVRVHSLVIRADERARETAREAMLRPRAVMPDSGAAGYAARAARHGSVRAFFLDGNAFPEPGGFWTRGDTATAVVLAADGPVRAVLRLRAGGVPVGVRLTVRGWTWDAPLEAGETREVALPSPAPGQPVAVTIATTGGFRPAEHEPGSRDTRLLGVWISW